MSLVRHINYTLFLGQGIEHFEQFVGLKEAIHTLDRVAPRPHLG